MAADDLAALARQACLDAVEQERRAAVLTFLAWVQEVTTMHPDAAAVRLEAVYADDMPPFFSESVVVYDAQGNVVDPEYSSYELPVFPSMNLHSVLRTGVGVLVGDEELVVEFAPFVASVVSGGLVGADACPSVPAVGPEGRALMLLTHTR